jgi:hypothetical protein
MNSKLLALIATVIIASSVVAGAYVLSLSNSTNNGVQDSAVDNPSPSTNDLTNTTINAINSTIIAGENSTIINPTATPSPTVLSTATPQPTATQVPTPTPTPTPVPYDFTVTYHEVERNATTITMSLTFSNFRTLSSGESNILGTLGPQLFNVAKADGNTTSQTVYSDVESFPFGNPPGAITVAFKMGGGATSDWVGNNCILINGGANCFRINYVKT